MGDKAPAPDTAPTPFQLSRIYAKGWIAGSRSDLDPGDGAPIAALNPYDSDVERARWMQGFTEAQARRVRR